MAIHGADKLKLRPRKELYIAMEDADTTFTYGEVKAVKELYNMNNNVFSIARFLDRDQDEVAVLIIDLGRKDKLKRLRVVYPQTITANSIAWYLYNIGWSIEEIGKEMYRR